MSADASDRAKGKPGDPEASAYPDDPGAKYGTPLLRDSARRRSSGCTCGLFAGALIVLALAVTAVVIWVV